MTAAFPDEGDWDDHPRYRDEPVRWEAAPSGAAPVVYQARVGGRLWRLRLNDFPDEPLYTLFDEGERVLDFTECPAAWTLPGMAG